MLRGVRGTITTGTYQPRRHEGRLPWPLAMATGHGHWPWPLAMAAGRDRWPWPLAMASGHGRWLAAGHGQWPWPLAMATGHGHWPWLLAMATGHGYPGNFGHPGIWAIQFGQFLPSGQSKHPGIRALGSYPGPRWAIAAPILSIGQD